MITYKDEYGDRFQINGSNRFNEDGELCLGMSSTNNSSFNMPMTRFLSDYMKGHVIDFNVTEIGRFQVMALRGILETVFKD